MTEETKDDIFEILFSYNIHMHSIIIAMRDVFINIRGY